MYENDPKYYNSCSNEIIQVAHVPWLDILVLYEFRDDEDTDEREEKKDLKIELLYKKHEDQNNSQPEHERNCGDLFSVHTCSCCGGTIILFRSYYFY